MTPKLITLEQARQATGIIPGLAPWVSQQTLNVRETICLMLEQQPEEVVMRRLEFLERCGPSEVNAIRTCLLQYDEGGRYAPLIQRFGNC